MDLWGEIPSYAFEETLVSVSFESRVPGSFALLQCITPLYPSNLHRMCQSQRSRVIFGRSKFSFALKHCLWPIGTEPSTACERHNGRNCILYNYVLVVHTSST